MKVVRGITLAFWIMLMTGCVSLVAAYYILNQTVLNPAAVKGWLNDSGAYSSLAETIVPSLTTPEDSTSPAAGFITTDMVKRAAKASIHPEDIKAKAEPVIDATYAWLDSKSPELNFSIPVQVETDRFFNALRVEVLAKVKTLPDCTGYVDPEAFETANCLPWYVSAEAATDGIMDRVKGQSELQGTTLTPDSFKAGATLSKSLPSFISFLWVTQLIAMPIFGLVALFVIVKRRALGLIAVSTSLLLPGLTLLVAGLLLQLNGASFVESLVSKSEIASMAEALGKVIAKSLASVTLQTGLVLLGSALLTGVLGILWRKRIRAKTNS